MIILILFTAFAASGKLEATEAAKEGNIRETRIDSWLSLGGHFVCLCRGFDFYEVKKNIIIIFQKENGNTFTLLIIILVKSIQKEQNSTNHLL